MFLDLLPTQKFIVGEHTNQLHELNLPFPCFLLVQLSPDLVFDKKKYANKCCAVQWRLASHSLSKLRGFLQRERGNPRLNLSFFQFSWRGLAAGPCMLARFQISLDTLGYDACASKWSHACPAYFSAAWYFHYPRHRRVSHGLGWPANAMFFYNRIREKQFFTLPVVNDNEIVRNTTDGAEKKSGSISSMRCIRSCWYRRVSQFLVTLDNGKKQNGVGWPPKTMRNSSILASQENHYQPEFIGTLENEQPRVVRSQLLRAGRYRRVHPSPKSKSSAESCQAVTKPSLTFSAFQVTFLSLPTKGKRQRVR